MRALRMAFAAAFPFEIRPFNRARSSSLSLTTNFLFATAIPLVGSIRQNKNQYSRRNATSLFKWCIPLVQIGGAHRRGAGRKLRAVGPDRARTGAVQGRHGIGAEGNAGRTGDRVRQV